MNIALVNSCSRPIHFQCILWEDVDQRNPTSIDYPKHLVPEPWYRQLEIRALAIPIPRPLSPLQQQLFHHQEQASHRAKT